MSNGHSDDMNGLDSRITVRGYFERIIKEHQEAIKVAEQERSKTAENVRRALEEQMKAGDMRLEDHITHQIEQIKQGLASLNAILKERDDRTVEQRKYEEQRFLEFKEMTSNEFKHVNEFRASLDDLGKLMATRRDTESLSEKLQAAIDRNRDDISEIRSQIIGKETYNAGVAEWTKWRTDIDTWKDRTAGKGEGVSGTTKVAIGVAVFIATVLGIISFFMAVTNKDNIDKHTQRIYQQQQKP